MTEKIMRVGARHPAGVAKGVRMSESHGVLTSSVTKRETKTLKVNGSATTINVTDTTRINFDYENIEHYKNIDLMFLSTVGADLAVTFAVRPERASSGQPPAYFDWNTESWSTSWYSLGDPESSAWLKVPSAQNGTLLQLSTLPDFNLIKNIRGFELQVRVQPTKEPVSTYDNTLKVWLVGEPYA